MITPYKVKCMRCGKEKNLEKRGAYVCTFCKGGSKGIPLGWGAIKRMCFVVFGKKCAICGTTQRLCIHHKDKNRTNNSLKNLEVRCVQCHPSMHRTNDGKISGISYGSLGNKILYTKKFINYFRFKFSKLFKKLTTKK